MQIFVTGATGFVGSAVVSALLRHGHTVTGLVRNLEKAKNFERAGMKIAVGDMLEPASYVFQVPAADVVIHAAQLTIPGRFSRTIVDRVQHADAVMTRALADACLQHGKKLIYTNGNFSYAPGGDAWINEDSPMEPPYFGAGHYRMVQELEVLGRGKGLKYLVLTAGFVYGPGGLFTRALLEPLQKKQLMVVGKGDNYWSNIHVDDLGEAFALAAESPLSGERLHIVDDEPITLRALIDALTNALGTKRLGNIAPWILSLILGGPLVNSLVLSYRLSNKKAKERLGWKPRFVRFSDGLPSVLKSLGVLK